MSEKGKKDIIEANQPGLPGSMAGPIPSIKKIRKVEEKSKRVRKRDKIKKLTREQIEKIMAKAKKTWLSMNDILRYGKWNKKDKNKDGEV